MEHRQDMCFKLNAWQQNSNVWVTMKNDEVEEMLKLFFNLLNLFRKELTNYEMILNLINLKKTRNAIMTRVISNTMP